MKNALRKQSGASPQDSARNSDDAVQSQCFLLPAACLVLIVGVSFAMPGVVAGIRPGDYAGYETAASMYGGGAALGYIVIGLLSFLLGVCVTVLCLPT